MVGSENKEGMVVHTSGKRKSSDLDTNDSDSDASTPNKVAAKDYAAVKSTGTASVNGNEDMTVVIAGRTRPMKHWHPTTVNNAIRTVIGDCSEIKMLPSGDLAVTCQRKR